MYIISNRNNNHKHMPPSRQLNHGTDAKKLFKFIDARLLVIIPTYRLNVHDNNVHYY